MVIWLMKTTLNIDQHVLRAAKKLAAERGTTLTQIVEDALREAIAERPAEREYRLRLTTTKGDRPPAADAADREALYDAMEGRS